MSLTIECNPTELTFGEFSKLNDICFPHEPVGEVVFQEYIAAHFWTVRSGESLVGYAVMSRGSSTPFIKRLGVHPDFRRTGIATKLMVLMLALAQKEKVTKVFALVEQDNHAVIGLNRKFGFEVTGDSVNFSISVGAHRVSDYKAVPFTEYEWNTDNLPIPESLTKWSKRHDPPIAHVLVLLANEKPIGYTRFCPDYPGCSPFVLFQKSEAIQEIVDCLDGFVLPEKRRIGITTGDQSAISSLKKADTHVNYMLYEMSKAIAS